MAEGTTGCFVRLLVVGMGARRLGQLIGVRVALGIRTGKTRQKQQPDRKKIKEPSHAGKGRCGMNATGSQKLERYL